MDVFGFLSTLFLEYSYVAVFGVLLLCGLGLPLPEEVTLIAAGVVVYEGRAELIPMMVVTVVGILVGDSLLFYFGRRFGPTVLQRKWIARLLHVERMNKVRREFDRHGNKAVFFARFFAGIRGLVYFTAGTLGMRYRTLLLLDLLGALLSAPISVWLGFRFGAQIEQLLLHVKQLDRVLLVVLVLIVLYFVFRRPRNPDDSAKNSGGPTTPSTKRSLASDPT